MSIKEQRASNELHIKITWVLKLDSSNLFRLTSVLLDNTEFQLSIFMATCIFLV